MTGFGGKKSAANIPPFKRTITHIRMLRGPSREREPEPQVKSFLSEISPPDLTDQREHEAEILIRQLEERDSMIAGLQECRT